MFGIPAYRTGPFPIIWLSGDDNLRGGIGWLHEVVASCMRSWQAPRRRGDADDIVVGFFNLGADIDIMAPGRLHPLHLEGGGYNTISGTSMATPHVSGGAGLCQATPDGNAERREFGAGRRAAAGARWTGLLFGGRGKL